MDIGGQIYISKVWYVRALWSRLKWEGLKGRDITVNKNRIAYNTDGVSFL